MDVWLELLRQFAYAIVGLLLNPFLYIAILFLALQYSKQIRLERKLFHVRLHSLRGEMLRSIAAGVIGGIAVSLIMLAFGAQLTHGTIIILWLLSLVMMLFRVRFLCLAYSAGVLGIAHAIFAFFPDASEWKIIGPVINWIMETQMSSLLLLVGLLHILEGVLVAKQAERMASPMFFSGKRGKIVGGYSLQSFWPVPLFLLMPLSTGGFSLPWTPLFGGDAWTAGAMIIGFPIMIGFSEISVARLPKQKIQLSSRGLLVYGAVISGLAVGSYYWTPLVIVTSVLSIALHEALIWYSVWREKEEAPLFVSDPRGLRILGVIPGSPAAEIGLKTGEIISKVNGSEIRTRRDLFDAIRINPAFCKLEVINENGEIKFAQRAIFSGDHHELGIIISPDQDTRYYVEFKQPNFFSFMKGKLKGLKASS
jgi:PDZ domain